MKKVASILIGMSVLLKTHEIGYSMAIKWMRRKIVGYITKQHLTQKHETSKIILPKKKVQTGVQEEATKNQKPYTLTENKDIRNRRFLYSIKISNS